MARRLRDKNLESRDARGKLKKSAASPTTRLSDAGCTSVTARARRAAYGWSGATLAVRLIIEKTIAQADDREDANGIEIMDFWQAQEHARNMRPGPQRGAYTVKDAVRDYLGHLEGRASQYDAKKRLEAYALPAFGDTAVATLDAEPLRAWHRSIAKQGARVRTKIGKTPQAYREMKGDPEAQRSRQASANRCLGLLKAALNHAWREGKCELGAGLG